MQDAISKEKQNIATKEALKRKEDEFEIKRLRLEKAIRDGETKQELERLRKELEDKNK